jgi:hypothetical protein
MLIKIENSSKFLNKINETLEGTFVKISYIDSWFYLGQLDNSLGAICLNKENEKHLERFNAIFNKSLNDEILWPRDELQLEPPQRKIEYIANYYEFLYIRALEEVRRSAELGESGIWMISVPSENSIEAITHSLKVLKINSEKPEMTELFKSVGFIPITLMSKLYGSWFQALGKIHDLGKLPYLSNNTSQNVLEQSDIAKRVILGCSYTIDAMTAFFLNKSGLLDKLLEHNPNIQLTQSFVKELYRNASVIKPDASSKGRIDLKNEKLIFNEANYEKHAEIYSSILSLIEKLDVFDKTYYLPSDPSLHEGLEDMFTEDMTDVYKLALSKECIVVSDDFSFYLCYEELFGKLPVHTSTIAIARALYDSRIITWSDYLDHHSLLAGWGFGGLSISSDNLLRCFFEQAPKQLIISQPPQQIQKLKLEFLLHSSYGLTTNSVINVLSHSFSTIIDSDFIVPEHARTLFSYLLDLLHDSIY